MIPTLTPAWANVRRPVIGMLHLPALPGAPRCTQPLADTIDFVLRDADALTAGGVHGLMLENFHDTPFAPGRVPAHVVAAMTTIAVAVRRRFDLPLGINVLRNDASGALAVAAAADAAFIRVNILCAARVTDQGVIQGDAYTLLRERALLNAAHVKILADVDVKHSSPLGPPRPVEDEVSDLIARGGADGLIVSGPGTGHPTDLEELQRVKRAAGQTPIFVGSGVSAENIAGYATCADGFIVGTSLKWDSLAAQPVDRARVAALLARLP